MSLAALIERLASAAHRFSGYGPPPHPAVRARETGAPLFDRLQRVLRLAGACPPGESGDAIRRAACEMIEAGSSRQRQTHRLKMLRAVTRAGWSPGQRAVEPREADRAVLGQLADALRDDFHED